MGEGALPDGVRRLPDGGVRVDAVSGWQRWLPGCLAALVVTVGLALTVVGLLLRNVLDDPGVFLAVGPVMVLGGVAVPWVIARAARDAGWSLTADGVTVIGERGDVHVPWGEVASLVLWDRHGRAGATGPWVRLVTMLVLDQNGEERARTSAENDERRFVIASEAAERAGIVPAHVRFDRRTGRD